VVSGEFAHVGSVLKLNARLTEVPTAEVVWTGSEEGPVEELFALQERLASALATRLHGVRSSVPTRSTFTLDRAQLELASNYVQRALQADPDCAEAHVWSGYLGFIFDPDPFPAHLRSFEKAMALNPSDHLAPYFAAGCLSCSCRRGQADRDGAQAAFTQAVFHLRGRFQARSGGQVLVRALASLAQAGTGAEPFEEALQLFTTRQDYRFDFFPGCTDDGALLELHRAARTLGRTVLAGELFTQAIDAGSVEAQRQGTPPLADGARRVHRCARDFGDGDFRSRSA
jgi:hypothetical protein